MLHLRLHLIDALSRAGTVGRDPLQDSARFNEVETITGPLTTIAQRQEHRKTLLRIQRQHLLSFAAFC